MNYIIIMSILLLVVFLGMIFSLGRWFQVKYNIFNATSYSIPLIGFVLFLFITILTYIIPFLFDLQTTFYVIFEIVKDLGIITFLFINKASIKFKGSWGQILNLIFLAILLVNIQYLLYNNDAYKSNDIINKKFTHVFEGKTISKTHDISKAWFMFNSILIYISNISVKANVYWIQGIIITLLSISAIFSYISSIKRKGRILAGFICTILSFIGWYVVYTYKGDYIINAGIAVILLALPLYGWEIISRPQIAAFALSAMSVTLVIAFEPILLWIFCFYFISISIIYIFKTKPKIMLLLSLHSISIIFSIIIALGKFNKIAFISFFTIFLLLLLFKFKNINTKTFGYFNMKLYTIRWFILGGILISLIISSMIIFLVTKGTSTPWNQFKESESLTKGSHFSFAGAIVKYVCYSILGLIGLVNSILIVRNQKSLNLINYLYIFGTLMFVLFFNPLSYPLLSFVIGRTNSEWVSWVSVIPIIISLSSDIVGKSSFLGKEGELSW